MQNIADAAGCGIATLYRYFDKKQGFVIETATKKWILPGAAVTR